MQQTTTIAELRNALASVRGEGKRIAVVPTMGNLHQGHLSLVEIAKQHAEHIVVTIFVNPTQFVQGEDYEHYPRTVEDDLALLSDMNVDTVFMPSVDEIYPAGAVTEVLVPTLDSIYCGEYRPGHFKGVATVVAKLLNIVQPDAAVFGEKDYQQLLVIRQLVQDLNIPVTVIGGSIVRESNGLAMSSRNRYLSDDERQQAATLYRCLQEMATLIRQGERNFADLEQQAMKMLAENGFRPEYVGICDANTLGSPTRENLVIIAAAWLGKARLIDNVAVQTYD